MSRIILHSDINSCFANIECLYNPELRGKPVSVCGSIEQRHGIVLPHPAEIEISGFCPNPDLLQHGLAPIPRAEMCIRDSPYSVFSRHGNRVPAISSARRTIPRMPCVPQYIKRTVTPP